MYKFTGYNLFWDEEKKKFYLRYCEETLGELPDDTKFAHAVLSAFNASAEFDRLKNQISNIKSSLEHFLKDANNMVQKL